MPSHTIDYRLEMGSIIRLPADLSPDKVEMTLRAANNNPAVRMGERAKMQRKMRDIGPLAEQAFMEKQLGGPLSPGDAPSVSPATRFDLGRSFTTEDQAQKVQKALPDAKIDILQTQDGDKKIAVTIGGATHLVDSADFNVIGDTAQILGNLFTEEMALQILAAIATKGKSVLTRAAGQAGSALIGSIAQTGVERARGFREEPLKSAGIRAGVAMTIAPIAEALFTPLSKVAQPIQTVRGAGLIKLNPEQQAAQKFASESGLPGLTLGQVHPLFERAEMRSSATSKVVPEARTAQLAGALKDMEGLQKQFGEISAFDDQALDASVREMDDALMALVTVKEANPDILGNLLAEGRKVWIAGRRAVFKEQYTRAHELADGPVTWNLRKAQKVARRVLAGKRLLAKEKIPDAPMGIPPQGGREAVRASQEVSGKLKSQLEKLLKMDPDAGGVDSRQASEALQDLRTSFFDLKTPAAPGAMPDQNNHWASNIYNALTDTIANPKGGGEAFSQAWIQVSKDYFNFSELSQAPIMRVLASVGKGINPEDAVLPLMRGGNFTNLSVLKETMPAPLFTQLKDAFKTQLIRRGDDIGNVLDSYRPNPKELGLLLTPDEQLTFRQLHKGIRALRSSPAKKLLDEDEALGQRAVRLVMDGTNTQLDAFIKSIGGRESAKGRGLQAGVAAAILDKATTFAKNGRRILDAEKALAVFDKLNKTGRLDRILDPTNRKLLGNRELYLRLQPSPRAASDTGASIAGQEIVSKAFDPAAAIAKPKTFIGAWYEVARSATIGWFVTSPAVRKILLGRGKPQSDLVILRGIVSGIAAISAQAQERE